jgi:hypothetical protein
LRVIVTLCTPTSFPSIKPPIERCFRAVIFFVLHRKSTRRELDLACRVHDDADIVHRSRSRSIGYFGFGVSAGSAHWQSSTLFPQAGALFFIKALRLVTIEYPSAKRTAQEFMVPRQSTSQGWPLRSWRFQR